MLTTKPILTGKITQNFRITCAIIKKNSVFLKENNYLCRKLLSKTKTRVANYKTIIKTIAFLVGAIIAHTDTILAQETAASIPYQAGTETTCHLQDKEGFWWYGGKDAGLCRFDGYDTESFRSDRQNPHLLRSNDVLCMTELPGNAEIWFGTKEGAYILSKKDYRVRPIVVKTKNGDNELTDKRINCIITANDGSVWLSYRNQLLHLSAKAKMIERFETTWEGKNRSVSLLCFDKQGNLLASLWNGGIVRLKKNHGKWQMEATALTQIDTGSKSSSQDDIKHRLDSVMSRQAPQNDATVLSWAKGTKENHYYIGSYHSLYLYDGEHLQQLETDLDKVRSMAYSKQRQALFLLSKTRGICQWKDQKLTILHDTAAFRHIALNSDTALLLSDGMTSVCLLNLQTLKLTNDTIATDINPIVTAYAIDGQKRPMGYGKQTITLSKDISIVEIYLSTLDYEHTSQVQFAYRMNNQEWIVLPVGEHIAKFANLAGGVHQLEVRATDVYGRWSHPITVLTIDYPTAWYHHWWLWIVVLVVIGVAGLLFYRKNRNKQVTTDVQEENNSEETSVVSAADQEFIDKAKAAVAANMINSDYSVDALASDLCMSRSSLHRKMRSITGLTPTDFIRNQRLERAAELLRTTSHSVNEIVDLVGFSYASYFTKCFKEKYGVLPKDY